ncbi:MAG: HIRAN domain-containing protein [Elusimicrobiota bacterium]
MNLIEHIFEPNHLFLVWKDPKGRSLRVIAKLERDNGGARLTYLVDTDDFKLAQKNGFMCYPAFPDINRTYTINVLEVFSKRIPPRQREDYNEFLAEIRLPANAGVSDFALLGYSEVRLPSDGYAIINPFDEVDSDCEFLSEIAGLRYYDKAINLLKNQQIKKGVSVAIMPDDDNQYDNNAVKVLFKDQTIGYVNRIQAKTIRRWLSTGKKVLAEVEKINGSEDRPSVILFIKVRV